MKFTLLWTLRLFVSCSFAGLSTIACSGDDNGSNSQTNHPPQIEAIIADPDTFFAGQVSTVTVTASDPDGDELSYSWEAAADWLLPMPSGGNVLVLTNCCPITKPESAMVHSTVTDGRGGEARDSIRLCALPVRAK